MDQSKGIRLNKYISMAGVCSRREADRLLTEGHITVDGKTAEPGMRVEPGQIVLMDGKPLKTEDKPVILLFHKPRGIVCTAEKREKNNVVDYIHYPTRIYPVGRLDKASRGLLLLTNRGEIANLVMKAGEEHEKEYEVRLHKPYQDLFLQEMKKGVYLKELDKTTAPCEAERIDERTFRIVLHQGLNRQIRRMSEALGYHVVDLKRVRIMNIRLGKLPEGKYREITPEEERELNRRLGISAGRKGNDDTEGRDQGAAGEDRIPQ